MPDKDKDAARFAGSDFRPVSSFAFVPAWTSPYLPLSPASEATNPASSI
jgi:hypothetical protein